MQTLTNTTLELTEIKLLRMQDLKRQIKILESEKDMLQAQVIESYFKNSSEFKTARGLVLATYESHKEKRFSKELFEQDNPGIYDLYKKEAVVYKFLLK